MPRAPLQRGPTGVGERDGGGIEKPLLVQARVAPARACVRNRRQFLLREITFRRQAEVAFQGAEQILVRSELGGRKRRMALLLDEEEPFRLTGHRSLGDEAVEDVGGFLGM